MAQSLPLNCSVCSFAQCSNSSSRSASSSSTVCGSVFRNYASIPKLDSFSRNKLDRFLKEPPLIQKSQNQIADYCLTLEGDECYSCWKAYFALKDLEKVAPKEEVERLIRSSGASLIDWVPGILEIYKTKKEDNNSRNQAKSESMEPKRCPEPKLCPIPDGLPKTAEEIEEEEKDRMPDSPFTRVLRARGRYPAWYTPRPDHETD